jgi:hypothetical protein
MGSVFVPQAMDFFSIFNDLSQVTLCIALLVGVALRRGKVSVFDRGSVSLALALIIGAIFLGSVVSMLSAILSVPSALLSVWR